MALISSVSMTLMVKGTLQSEFLTMFWPMRLTYSVMTGSLMNLVLFSTSSAYCLPILISDSVEYQLPMPRAPMLRVPTAFTSSMLPPFTPGIMPFWSGSACLNGLTLGSVRGLPLLAVWASSPEPGAGALAGGTPEEHMSPPLSAGRWRTGPGQFWATWSLAALGLGVWAAGTGSGACCAGADWAVPVEAALDAPVLCAWTQLPARARPAQTNRLKETLGVGMGGP